MQNEQLSEQRPDDEPRRLEYRSPALARLGKLVDVTLQVGTTGRNDQHTSDKTG